MYSMILENEGYVKVWEEHRAKCSGQSGYVAQRR